MLSICIPVYNYPVGDLLASLSNQILLAKVPVEVVVLDDGSNDAWRRQNEGDASKYACVRYHYQTNLGRAITRNALASLAKFNFLAFIDCDCSVTDDYVATVLNHVAPNSVLVGGLVYPPKPFDKNLHLRWKVGTKREVKSVAERQRYPYASFLSSNFVMPRHIMATNGFNVQLTGYGHEDTLLGIDLQRHKVPILHINNPVCHLCIDSAADFLAKIEQSVASLSKIEGLGLAAGQIKLSATYSKLKKIGLAAFFCMVFVGVKPVLKRYFLKGGTNLVLFDAYKLGIYILLNKRK